MEPCWELDGPRSGICMHVCGDRTYGTALLGPGTLAREKCLCWNLSDLATFLIPHCKVRCSQDISLKSDDVNHRIPCSLTIFILRVASRNQIVLLSRL
jgi:hypothetical protein